MDDTYCFTTASALTQNVCVALFDLIVLKVHICDFDCSQ